MLPVFVESQFGNGGLNLWAVEKQDADRAGRKAAGGDFLPDPVDQMIAVGFNDKLSVVLRDESGEKTPQGRLGARVQMDFRLLEENARLASFEDAFNNDG